MTGLAPRSNSERHINLDKGNKVVQSQQKENTANKSNVFKINNRHQDDICCFYCFLWTYFAIYSTAFIAEFEQRNAGWIWEYIVSDNNFVFRNCELNILSYGLGKYFKLHSFFIRTSKIGP